ncbi:MAG TPA: cytochrome c oxidase subunit II [Puia sp.]|nr:cytochrome c oxidase subunit II [Puia sp.]
MLRVLLHIQLPPLFHPATPQAQLIGPLGNAFLLAASAMALLVIVLTIWITRTYRHSKNPGEPLQVRSNRKLEVFMIGIPLLLVTGFFLWSMQTMRAILPPGQGMPPDVTITGHQWFWTADYHGTGVTTANEIHLPIHRKILIQLTSADVIHDWWVPALGPKMDMFPDRNTYLWMTIHDTGVYEGACNEFCGAQHAWMRIRVVAQSPNDFDAWLAGQASPASSPRDSLSVEGAALFTTYTCGSCHSIKGTSADGHTGPDLTHLASRQTLLAGRMSNDPANLSAWLSDPQKVKPGAYMPRFIFGKDTIQAIVAYLENLK